jgi:hypothetical protein
MKDPTNFLLDREEFPSTISSHPEVMSKAPGDQPKYTRD